MANEVARAQPTDAELERAIVDAVRQGLSAVAKTFAAQLEERRCARVPENVVHLDEERKRRGS